MTSRHLTTVKPRSGSLSNSAVCFTESGRRNVRDGHETSMAVTETRRLQVSRRDRDVETHVVFNAVQVNAGLTTVATVTACPLVMVDVQ